MESVDEAAISEIVDKLKTKKTAKLVEEADLVNIVTANPPLKPSLRNRFEIRAVTVDDIQIEVNNIINRTAYDRRNNNRIPLFLCFARDEREHAALYKKIQENNARAIPNDGNPIVFIDMARTPMTDTAWKAYLESDARAEYLSAKNIRNRMRLENSSKLNWKLGGKQFPHQALNYGLHRYITMGRSFLTSTI